MVNRRLQFAANGSQLKVILERIQRLEEAVAKATEYLETGANVHWHGFRPLFAVKIRDGKAVPPHKDWVKNVFLPQKERALRAAYKLVEKLNSE